MTWVQSTSIASDHQLNYLGWPWPQVGNPGLWPIMVFFMALVSVTIMLPGAVDVKTRWKYRAVRPISGNPLKNMMPQVINKFAVFYL